MPTPDPESMRAAEAALATVADDWMARDGIASVELSRRWRDGAPTDEIAIRVTVASIRPDADVPAYEAFPTSVQGFPVEIVEGRSPAPERFDGL